MDKKGDYKYGLLFTLIMGLLVVGLSFYFIFNELFSDEDISYEVCRQSVITRSVLPDVTLKKISNLDSFKNSYPLKCETRKIEISEADVKDIEVAQRKIAETMMECWALFDRGDSSAFPPPGIWNFIDSATSYCVPCARLSLSEGAKDYMEKNVIEIDIREGLDLNVEGEEFSYFAWLKNSGEKFSAFDLATSSEFDLSGDEFRIEDGGSIINKLEFYAENGVLMVSLPFAFDVKAVDFKKDSSGALGVNSDLIKIAENMVNYLNQDNKVIVSDFCKGKDEEMICSVLKKYVDEKEDEDIVILEKGDDDWVVVVNKKDEVGQVGAVFRSRTGGVTDYTSEIYNFAEVSHIVLPRKFTAEDGDLLISYGIVVSDDAGDIGNYIPYLFYFQTEQTNVFGEVQNQLIDAVGYTKNVDFCEEWEGVPV